MEVPLLMGKEATKHQHLLKIQLPNEYLDSNVLLVVIDATL